MLSETLQENLGNFNQEKKTENETQIIEKEM